MKKIQTKDVPSLILVSRGLVHNGGPVRGTPLSERSSKIVRDGLNDYFFKASVAGDQ
jgi:hypothetical protein